MFKILKYNRSYLLAILIILGVTLLSNGQGNYLDQLTMDLLEESCFICNKNKYNFDAFLNEDKKRIVNLFHELHELGYSASNDSIINLSTQLKPLIDQYFSNDQYKQNYYFFYGRQLCKVKLYNEAYSAFEKSLNLSSDSLMLGLNNFYLAVTLIERNQFKESLLYLAKSEVIFEHLDKKKLLKTTYNNKAVIYTHLNEMAKAEQIYLALIEMNTTQNDSLELFKSYSNLAGLYYEQYLDDKAIPLYKKSFKLAVEINDLSTLIDAYDNMTAVYENMGNYKASYEHQSKYILLKDSLNDVETVRALSEQQKKAEKKQLAIVKDKEIALIEKDKQLLSVGIFSTLLILGLLSYFYFNSQKQNKIIASQKQKVDELNTIKDELLSVLGHDLRTPMQHLISVFDRSFRVLKKGEEGKLLKLLQHGNLAVNKTAILLDNILQWVTQQNNQTYFKKEAVVLAPLIHQITANFIPIMDMRSIQLERTVPAAATVLADRNSLKIIIRNIVDNAIKFTPTNGQIRIYTTTEIADKLTIHIQDTGSGMSPEVLNKLKGVTAPGKDASGRKSTGLGLRLSRDFIKRNDGTLKIESETGKGSTFSIELPTEISQK